MDRREFLKVFGVAVAGGALSKVLISGAPVEYKDVDIKTIQDDYITIYSSEILRGEWTSNLDCQLVNTGLIMEPLVRPVRQEAFWFELPINKGYDKGLMLGKRIRFIFEKERIEYIMIRGRITSISTDSSGVMRISGDNLIGHWLAINNADGEKG